MIKSCEAYSKMTDEEKFKSRSILYYDALGYPRLELWGGSTKHPDATFSMNIDLYQDRFQLPWWGSMDNAECVRAQTFQWLLYCASQLEMCCSAYEVLKLAQEYYENYRESD